MSIDLSLERIQRLVDNLPKYTRPTIHIAGTNGKGSVAAMLNSVLTASGFKTGRFTSPHLVEVHDCIFVDNEVVSVDRYRPACAHVQAVDIEYGLRNSSFELLTATALYLFEDMKVDIAIVEVGMGGRLDATNVIPSGAILVSAITSIALDHQAFLGNTLGEIAREKAGIARPGKPLVVASDQSPEIISAIQDVSNNVGAELFLTSVPEVEDSGRKLSLHPFHAPPSAVVRLPTPQNPDNHHPIEVSLRGKHQLSNLGVVSAVLNQLPSLLKDQISPDSLRSGLKSTKWRGRLSFHSLNNHTFLADGAHNTASATALSAYITSVLPNRINLTFILALSHSPPKTAADVLEPLLSPFLSRPETVLRVICTEFSPVDSMPWVKPVSSADVLKTISDMCRAANTPTPDVHEQSSVSAAVQSLLPSSADDLIIIAGSLYLLADFYRMEGIHDL